MRLKYRLENFRFSLVFLVLAISALGVLLVNSADSSLTKMEIIGVAAGAVLMICVSLIDYSFILMFYRILYLINIGLLAAVELIGHASGGAQRWLRFGNFQFQPSELCKIVLILFFAQYIMEHEDTVNDWKTIIKALFLFAIPTGLVFMQPDLSTTITIVAIVFLMMFAAGLSYKLIAGVTAVLAPLGVGLIFLGERYGELFLTENQYGRIMAWLHPEDYPNTIYQQTNSVTAIGSGQLFGKGLNNNVVGSVKNGNFILQPQTDFIFSIAGEELGFVGCVVMILLLLLIVFTCLSIGRRAKDTAGRMICVGMAAWVSVQSFVNIGVTTGLLPNTGIPLPFVSYGLTSLLSLMIGMGLVLNVGLQRK